MTNEKFLQLTEAVTSRLGTSRFELHSIEVQSLAHEATAGVTGGLRRVNCVAETLGGCQTLSFAVKRLVRKPGQNERWSQSDQADDPFFWKREALAYQHAAQWPSETGIQPCRCFHQHETWDDITLFLEWLEEPDGRGWPPNRYHLAARQLGAAQAQTLGRSCRALASPRSYLDLYVERRIQLIAETDEWTGPGDGEDVLGPLRPFLPAVRQVMAARFRILAALAAMPAVFCHNDLWSPNLFGVIRNGTPTTVMIDLAYCGFGTPGVDAGNLVIDAVLDFFIETRLAHDLWNAVTTAYRAGLESGGLTIPAAELDSAMRCALALKYAWMVPATFRALRRPQSRLALTERRGDVYRLTAQRAAALQIVGEFVCEAAANFSG